MKRWARARHSDSRLPLRALPSPLKQSGALYLAANPVAHKSVFEGQGLVDADGEEEVAQNAKKIVSSIPGR